MISNNKMISILSYFRNNIVLYFFNAARPPPVRALVPVSYHPTCLQWRTLLVNCFLMMSYLTIKTNKKATWMSVLLMIHFLCILVKLCLSNRIRQMKSCCTCVHRLRFVTFYFLENIPSSSIQVVFGCRKNFWNC